MNTKAALLSDQIRAAYWFISKMKGYLKSNFSKPARGLDFIPYGGRLSESSKKCDSLVSSIRTDILMAVK